MKILITGANGFLGSWVTRALLSDGHDVKVLVRPTSDLSEIEHLRFTKAFGDVTNYDSVVEAMKDTEAVFHLAGVIGYRRWERPLMEKVNIGGTQNVLKACEKIGVKNLVYLSSIVAIGAGFKPEQILNENSAYNLGHLRLGYFDTKHEAEKLVIEAHERGLVEAVIVNPSTIYGPGDAKKGSRTTQLRVARGQFPFYTHGGVNVIDVEDVIYGIVTAWKKKLTGERFVLAGENLLIKDLFALIAASAGVKAPSWPIPNAILFALGYLGDIQHSLGFKSALSVENAWSSTLYHWFDNSKAKKHLGLHPNPAKFAISKSVAWTKEHRLLNR
jgi:dihydroflavonol-4-reductase